MFASQEDLAFGGIQQVQQTGRMLLIDDLSPLRTGGERAIGPEGFVCSVESLQELRVDGAQYEGIIWRNAQLQ